MKNIITIYFPLWLLLSATLVKAQPDAAAYFSEEHKDGSAVSATHYAIFLEAEDFSEHSIQGSTVIDMTAAPNSQPEVFLNIISLTVDSIKQAGTLINDFVQNDTAVYFTLAAPTGANGDFSVEVFYHGVPFHENWGGFHWSGDYCFNLGVGFESIPHNLGRAWFPCIDNFTSRATYDLHIRVENPKKAVCGGLLTEVVADGDNHSIYHWQINHPVPAYLASVAIGEYAEVTDVYEGIAGDIPIRIFVRPQDSAKVSGTFQNLKDIMQIYETHFGAYPWERIGYVGTSTGAMEHVMNVAYPHSAIDGTTNNDWWYAHELFHMWFGDNVTCSSAGDMWLNEGWASFAEAFFQEFLYNDRELYINYLRPNQRKTMQYSHTPLGDGSYFPLNAIPQDVTYGVCAYKKGSVVAHSLRGYLGDELFFDVMTDYQTHFAYQSVSSHDMEERMTTFTGVDMHGFFDNWIYHSGTPHYSIDSFAVQELGNGQYQVNVYVRQKHKGPSFTGDGNKMYIDFVKDDWSVYTDTVFFDGSSAGAAFILPFYPRMVVSDMYDRMMDARINYNATIKETGQKDFEGTFFKLETDVIEDSCLFRIEHHWVAPDSLKTPVQGLRISDYRYWTVDGIFPENFQATGLFKYSKSGYLDNTLILSEGDSAVLLYRPDASADWTIVPTERIGFWYTGILYYSDLQKGDYTLGVIDSTFTGISTAKHKPQVRIYPNPAHDLIRIRSSAAGLLKLYSPEGKLIDHKNILQDTLLDWDISALKNDTYFMLFYGKETNISRTFKLIKN